jgi:hypothetical protein
MSWFALKVGDGILLRVFDLISKAGKVELNNSSVLLNYSEGFDKYWTLISLQLDLSFINKSGRDALIELSKAQLHYKGNTKHLIFKDYNVPPIFRVTKINAEIKRFELEFLLDQPRFWYEEFHSIINTAKFELNYSINKVEQVLVVDAMKLNLKCVYKPGPGYL